MTNEKGKKPPTAVIKARVSEDFHRRIKAAAAADGKSIQEVVLSLLQSWLAAK